MARRNILLALLVVAALGAAAGVDAKSTGSAALRLVVPATVDGQTTVAVSFALPRGTAAVDGRLLLDKSGAEVVGLAPVGGGVALAPVEIADGYAFGAYGLTSSHGQTTLHVILAPLAAGRVALTLVIDSAADAQGQRLTLSSTTATGKLKIAKGAKLFSAPTKTTKPGPSHAAGATRDLVADGAVGKMDLDIVRAAWELAQANGVTCGSNIDVKADANGDGCVDIVDLQAIAAAQGQQVAGTKPHRTADTASASSVVNGINTNVTASVAGAPLPAAFAADAAGLTFTVTSTDDTPDANNGDGICADAAGHCTLRAAITEANWQLGPNTIQFNLPGTAPVPIQLSATAMSQIQDRSGGLVIDGYSQPGSHVNTATVGSNAVPGVLLMGTADAPRGVAFRITSANNVIRGFLINNFWRAIFIDGTDAHDNSVIGNILGFTAAGAQASYSGYDNFQLNTGANHNNIGAPALADRNVSGRAGKAVYLYGPGTDYNVIQNNVLCMAPDGMTASRCTVGVDHDFGPKHNLVGGAGTNERNVVGPTARQAVEISHGWDPNGVDTSDKYQLNDNHVVGNWLGFRGDGSYSDAFRSGQDNPGSGDNGNGVNIHDGCNDNVIEGNWVASVYDGIQTMSPNSSGNIVRGNIVGESPLGEPAPLTRDGIVARISTRSSIIEGNIVRNAGRYGIGLTQKDVLWVKVSQNIVTDMSGPAIFFAVDPGDPTKGADDLIAPPSITAATTSLVSGSGIPAATIELYRASRPAGQSGLPVEYLGSTTVAGNGQWSIGSALQVGDRAAALQILPNNNTSALSLNVATTGEQPPSKPVADFSYSQQAGTTEVDFVDASTNSPASWSWSFGDGVTSTEQSPSHTYAVGGDYTVTLQATNAGGSSSVNKTVHVTTPNMAAVVANDSFSRSVSSGWGNAEVGGSYELSGSASNFSVDGSAAQMTLPAAGASRSVLLNAVSQRNVDIRFRVMTNKPATGGKIFVYAVARLNGNNEYRPRLVLFPDGSVAVKASKVVNGSESSLGQPVTVNGLSQVAGAYIWFRAQVSGASPTTIRIKAWADGQSEPAGWTFTTTDSQSQLQSNGAVGLRAYLEATVTNAPVTLGFDDYSVTSSASDTTVATDAFNRTKSSSWGGADIGGLYTLVGNASSFNVGSGVGTFDLPSGGATRSVLLNDVNQSSIDIRFRVALDKVPTGGNVLVYAVARRSGNSEYRPRITFNPNGTVEVNASVLVNGAESSLGSAVLVPGLTVAPGSFIWFHAQVSGANPTTIRVRAWADGQSEPSSWLFSTTNGQAGLQSSGVIGLRAYDASKVSNTPLRLSFDDYSVTATQ